MNRDDIARQLDSALDIQRQDARMRFAERHYWGDTWIWVARAIHYAAPILGMPADADISAWLASRPAALEATHEAYRREEEDPDGYGSATLWELRRAVDELVKKTGT